MSAGSEAFASCETLLVFINVCRLTGAAVHMYREFLTDYYLIVANQNCFVSTGCRRICSQRQKQTLTGHDLQRFAAGSASFRFGRLVIVTG